MKRVRKKSLLKNVDMLIEVNSMLERQKLDEMAETVELLVSCQKLAIDIGDILENYNISIETIISDLEQYCEMIYQLSLILEDKDCKRKYIKRIYKLLFSIRNGIYNKVPKDNIEIVFMPYKASMWDSLESIWQAATQDDRCDVYVVPIPYYSKTPNGDMENMYCEDNQFPDYVPITNWNEYNFEERMPEIIYIHNPYDEGNYVTSTHPDFYSYNLKKYTDMLVYVPYFVAIDDNVARHLCVSSAVLCADRVIVQSEKVKKTYIEAIEEFEAKNECEGVFGKLKEKICAWGSPKYDKVYDLGGNKCDIPKEWDEFIYTAEDKRKRIVLYNTTIDAILNNRENFIADIETTLNSIKERKDIVLLWRPHPLLESTIHALIPEKEKEWKELIKRYLDNKIGIYDDSADLYRAIAVSNAYFGDKSSVMELYSKTGKPMLVKSTTSFHSGWKILSQDVFYEDEKVIFFEESMKRIFEMDYSSGKVRCLYKIDGIDNSDGYFGMPARINNRLIFPPANCESMLILEEDKFLKVPIDYNADLPYRFVNIVETERESWLLPGCSNAIICVDKITNKQEVVDQWFKNYLELIPDEYRKRKVFGKNRYGNWFAEGKTIYLPLLWVPVILEVQTDTKETRLIYIDADEAGGFLAIYRNANQHKYLIGMKNNLIVEMADDKVVKKHYCALASDEFGRSIRLKDKLLILGFKTRQLAVFDVNTEDVNIHALNYRCEENVNELQANYSCMLRISDEEFLIFDTLIGNFVSVKSEDDWKSIKVKVIDMILEDVNEIMCDEMQEHGYLYTNKYFTMETFWDMNFDMVNKDKKNYEKVGKLIFKKVLGDLKNE